MFRKRSSIILLCLLFVLPFVSAQQQRTVAPSAQKKEVKKESKYKFPLLNSLIIGVDLYSPVANLFGQKYGNYEVSLELDMHNRFMPTWEIGIGRANNRPEDMNFTYVVKPALYNRIGINYNFRYNSDGLGTFFVGLRYGFSSFNYDITNISIESPYWDTKYDNMSITGQHSSAQWFEALGGIRVRIYKDLMMGWSVRYKWLIKAKENDLSSPWFIPGYGNRGSSLGITYSIYYKFPLWKKAADNKALPLPLK